MNRAYRMEVLAKYHNDAVSYSVDDCPLDVTILTRSLSAANPEDAFGKLQCFKRKLADGQTVLVPWPEDFRQLSDSERHHWAAFEVTETPLAAPDDDPVYLGSIQQNVFGKFVDPPESAQPDSREAR